MRKLIATILTVLFPPQSSSCSSQRDDDLDFLAPVAYPDDKREDSGTLGAAQVLAMRGKEEWRKKTGTVCGAGDSPEIWRGRKLAERASLVRSCTPPEPNPDEFCTDWYCVGPRPKA